MLNSGDKAPLPAVADEAGNPLDLAVLAHDHTLVLYFYPKDDTPGCTIEANQFTALADDFAAANAMVLGVSKDDCASHRAFIEKFALRVKLLSDSDGRLCDAYGVWQEKEKNGVKSMGIVRSTFIIGRDGNLAWAKYGVTPDGHAAAVLDRVKQLL
jgi:peroxiredoxin